MVRMASYLPHETIVLATAGFKATQDAVPQQTGWPFHQWGRQSRAWSALKQCIHGHGCWRTALTCLCGWGRYLPHPGLALSSAAAGNKKKFWRTVLKLERLAAMLTRWFLLPRFRDISPKNVVRIRLTQKTTTVMILNSRLSPESRHINAC